MKEVIEPHLTLNVDSLPDFNTFNDGAILVSSTEINDTKDNPMVRETEKCNVLNLTRVRWSELKVIAPFLHSCFDSILFTFL